MHDQVLDELVVHAELSPFQVPNSDIKYVPRHSRFADYHRRVIQILAWTDTLNI